MSNKIKVAGYSQEIKYGNGISYRPFSPDLVGIQLTSRGGTPLFTMGNFSITTNSEPKTDKIFKTNEFLNFVTLSSLDLTTEQSNLIVEKNTKVKLNIDKI